MGKTWIVIDVFQNRREQLQVELDQNAETGVYIKSK